MSWIENSRPREEHALFSPSQPSWINYSNEEFAAKLPNKFRSDLGDEIHEWALHQIELGHKATSVREIQKDIETHIHEKYWIYDYDISEYRASDYGSILLRCMKYIDPVAYNTIKCYINDAVGFKMKPEVKIKYTKYFFGKADTLKFDGKLLRIHDLKTGTSPVHIEQLMIYAALFFLKIGKRKNEELDGIATELRIYQNNDILIAKPERDDLVPIMNKIVVFDRIMEDFFEGGA